MRRRDVPRPLPTGRPARRSALLGAAALGAVALGGALAVPASAATPPAAPIVTPSTTGMVGVGTPMTMTVAPGSPNEHVYGYAWTWQPAQNAPAYDALPACGTNEAPGGIHFVCGASATLRVSPEGPPSAHFTVWAFDATGDRSAPTTVEVDTTHDVAALYPVTHQWSTDQYGMVPSAARCAIGAVTVDCVPDSAGVDATHPAGAHPLLLPPGATWDGSGSSWGVPGVLSFGSANRLPAGTPGAVVDSRRSASVGAWLTPAALPVGGAATAVAEEGAGGTGFELGLTPDGHWQFRVHGAGTAAAVAPTGVLAGSPVYVAGVADAVNRELRLYLNGSLAAVAGYTPAAGHAPDGPATVGGRLGGTGVTDRWTGQIGNPVLVQSALTSGDVGGLAGETFFPGDDLN